MGCCPTYELLNKANLIFKFTQMNFFNRCYIDSLVVLIINCFYFAGVFLCVIAVAAIPCLRPYLLTIQALLKWSGRFLQPFLNPRNNMQLWMGMLQDEIFSRSCSGGPLIKGIWAGIRVLSSDLKNEKKRGVNEREREGEGGSQSHTTHHLATRTELLCCFIRT